jgi:hypothetical protein
MYRLFCDANDLKFIFGRTAFASSIIGVRSTTYVAFFFGLEDHRHRFRMNRFDDRIRRRGQETADKMRSGDGFRLGAAVTFGLGPESGKGEQRPVVV